MSVLRRATLRRVALCSLAYARMLTRVCAFFNLSRQLVVFQVGLLTDITELDWAMNKLTGTLPTEIGFMSKVSYCVLNW